MEAIVEEDIGTATPEEFFDVVRQASIIGKISGFREVAFRVRMLAMTSGSRAFWVGQARPKPISKPALNGSALTPLKVTGIIVATKESLMTGGPITEQALQRDLERACTELLDQSFIDVAATGTTNEQPASITSAVTPISATSDAAADIAALIADFAGDLSAAYFVSDPLTAAQLALARDAGGAPLFPDCGVRGGQILGVPVVVSRSSPRDSSGGQIALVDPTSIALGFGGIRVAQSEQASLLMSDDSSDEGEQVSMWQTNSVAFLAEMESNWEVQQHGAVSVLTGCSW